MSTPSPARRLRRFSTLVVLVLLGGCRPKTPTITAPFHDDFDRAEIGPTWFDTSGGQFHIVGGKLAVSMGHNHPLWLKQRLPADVVVDMDVSSKTPEGDIKIELYGDGESFDPDQGRYDPTSYTFVFGGWHNQLSIIGRLGEHDDGVKARRREPKVVPGQTYHFTITRKGGQLDWKIDGQPFLSWTDPAPLTGDGHAYLAVTNWEADVSYDNLQIRPAP